MVRSTDPFVAADGTVMTDALVEELASEAENGFKNSQLIPLQNSPFSRALEKTEPMRTVSLRVPEATWNMVRKDAAREGMSASEYARRALNAAVTGERLQHI